MCVGVSVGVGVGGGGGWLTYAGALLYSNRARSLSISMASSRGTYILCCIGFTILYICNPDQIQYYLADLDTSLDWLQ